MIYLIPKSLDLELLGSKPKERAKYLSILDYICKATVKNKEAGRGSVNVWSKVLKRLATSRYKKYIKDLEKWGVFWINDSYCVSDFNIKGSFPKSYMISTPEFVTHQEDYTPKWRFIDRTNYKDTVCALQAKIIHESCSFNMDRTRGARLSIEDMAECESQSSLFLSKKGSVVRGNKGRRVFNPILGTRKTERQFIEMDGIPIIEWDLESAHCYLAQIYFTGDELERYQLMLNGIYTSFGMEREQGKEEIRKFFYAPKHHVSKLENTKNRFALKLKNEFPDAFANITSKPGQLIAVELQNLESHYFNDFLILKSAQLGIKCVSMHDGYCTNSIEAGNTLKYLLEAEFLKQFSLAPTITIKSTVSEESKLLSKG